MNYDERIANGECVSPLTSDRCPVCIDTCEAFRHRVQVNELKELAENGDSDDKGWSFFGSVCKAHYFTFDKDSGYFFSLCHKYSRQDLNKPNRGLDPYEKCKICMNKEKLLKSN